MTALMNNIDPKTKQKGMDPVPKIKLIHIITSLDTGGAQMMLYKLLSAASRDEFDLQVISLLEAGTLGEKISRLGIPVWSLNMQRSLPDPRAVYRLRSRLKMEQPDLVQTWMYHADLIGGLAARKLGIPVLWNLRQSDLSSEESKAMTRATAHLCGRWSSCIPQQIVCCSESARTVHIDYGYEADKMVVIPNGFEVGDFKPDAGAYHDVRRELGLSPDAFIIGSVARFDPQKDHAALIQAAALIHEHHPQVYFILCGRDLSPDNHQLIGMISAHGLQDRFHLLGLRDDIARLTAAFDLAWLTSAFGEGFPNVVGEAMACGVPCLVTDVGDSGLIVGSTGRVVPPRQPATLAEAARELIEDPTARQTLGRQARRRIEENYTLPRIVKQYEDLYRSCV